MKERDHYAEAVERGRREVVKVDEWWQARVAARTPEDELDLVELRHEMGLPDD